MIDNADDLDIVKNIVKYSQNYYMTSGSLWSCYRDEFDHVDDNAWDGKSFEYKIKIVGKTPQRPARPGNEEEADQLPQPAVSALHIEVTIQHKYLSNLWRSFDLPLVNCEIPCVKSVPVRTRYNSVFGHFSHSDRTRFLMDERLCIDRIE